MTEYILVSAIEITAGLKADAKQLLRTILYSSSRLEEDGAGPQALLVSAGEVGTMSVAACNMHYSH